MPRSQQTLSRARSRPVALATVFALVAAVFASGLSPSPAHAAAGDIVVPPGQLAVTFVARVCSEYTDIMANRARNDIQESLRDLGKDTVYTAGQPISPSIEEPNQPACKPLRDWDFQMGTGYKGKSEATNFLSTVSGAYSTPIATGGPIAELDKNGVDTGRKIDGAVTITLTADQAKRAQQNQGLWAQGGTVSQTLPISGEYGFGALRCAVDNLNGDNVEFISYPQAARHVFCYYFAVSPPPEAGQITVVKQLAPGTIGGSAFPFEGNISYDRPSQSDVGRFTLNATAASPGSQTFVRGAVKEPWTFQELPPAGWELVKEPTCSTQSGSTWSYSKEKGMAVVLAPGDKVVCTFTNQRSLTGALFLYKGTINGTGSFPFKIDVPDPGTDTSTTVDVTTPNTLVEVSKSPGNLPGTYTATESLPIVDYGTWALALVLCADDGGAVQNIPFKENGQERVASHTIKEKQSTVCAFINEFTSDGAIEVSKVTKGGTGTFHYSLVPVEGASTSRTQEVTTTTEGEPVVAEPSDDSLPSTNLPIGSVWDVQEFLPAPTLAGYWRVVSADCGAAGRVAAPPDAVVRVKITEKNPRVECSFTNEFVSQGALEVVKNTSDDTALRPDAAQLGWSCDDETRGALTVDAGLATATTGTVVTTGFVTCRVTESESGVGGLAKVTTSATIDVNGTNRAYALGDDFVVQPEDSVVVTVDNTFTAMLPDTGQSFDARLPLGVGAGLLAVGVTLLLGASVRLRRS